MQKIKNAAAYLLASFVILIAVLVILVIWDVPINIDFELIRQIIGDGMLTLLTILTAGAVVALIFKMLFKAEVKPPTPPGSIGSDENN